MIYLIIFATEAIISKLGVSGNMGGGLGDFYDGRCSAEIGYRW